MKKVSAHQQLPQLFLLSIVGMLAVPLTLTAQVPDNPDTDPAPDAEIIIDESADTTAAPARRSGARGAYTDAVNAPVAPVTIRNYRAPIKPAPAHPPLPVSADTGARLQVTRINFTGNSVYSQATLAAIVSDRLGQSLSFQELLDLAARVENYYHRHGYQITRVIIPKQDARDSGVLEFKVLEGRLGKVNVSGNKRYATKRVLAALGHSVTVGEPFTIADLERPLVHLNDAAGLGADATLKPGEVAGTTDLDVTITERRRIGGSLEFNNFGSKDYSEWRAIPGLSLPNLTGVGDELSALGVLAVDNLDSWFYQVEYRRPLNTFGTALLLYFGQGRNVVGNEFDILDIQGDNLAWGAGLSHRF
ncbi:MAG: hypothetical protein LBK76_01910, partial [Verrucomicrobiales bacterium]|nr:hypothetical protein [Verrucomicrobiales bacterium]